MSVKSTQDISRDRAESLCMSMGMKLLANIREMSNEDLETLLMRMDDLLNEGESYRNYMIVEGENI